MQKTNRCPCSSQLSYYECCEPYFKLLHVNKIYMSKDSLFLDSLSSHAQHSPMQYLKRVNKFLFRISGYVDKIVDLYYPLNLRDERSDKDDSIYALKINILNSLIASLTCLSQGLLLQGGILQRSVIEDSLVLLEISEDEDQFLKFKNNKYNTNNLLSRTKKKVPTCIVNWYGYFSNNFTHSGQLRNIDILPMACHPDDYAVIVGLQNLTRACVCLHICLERLDFQLVQDHLFWRKSDASEFIFNEESQVFEWAYEMGKSIRKEFPGQLKEGFIRSEKSLEL